MRLLIFLLLSNFLSAQSNFYATTDCGNLLLIDVKNCTKQTLCIIPPDSLSAYDVAICPNQKLYVTNGPKIYELNKYNCSYSLVANIQPKYDDFLNSLVAIDDNNLLAASGNCKLYKINLQTGVFTYVDSLSYCPSGDITWYKDTLYMSANTNDLVKISFDTLINHVTTVKPVVNMNTPLNTVWGLATANNCIPAILEFESDTIFSTNLITGVTSFLCDLNFNPVCTFYGAASLPDLTNVVKLEVPNIFTPNGDHINDFFTPVNEVVVNTLHMQIYNRWGEVVYETNGNTFLWDGKSKSGKPLADGTYYYTLNYTDFCDKPFEKHGYLTLTK